MAGKRVPVRPVAKGGRQVRAESRGAPARESAFSGRKSLIFAAPGGREDGSVANFSLTEAQRPRQRRNRIPGVIPVRATRVRRQQEPRRQAAGSAPRADDRGRDRRFRGVSGGPPPARSPRPAVRGRTARRPGRSVQPGGAGGDLRGSAAPGLGAGDGQQPQPAPGGADLRLPGDPRGARGFGRRRPCVAPGHRLGPDHPRPGRRDPRAGDPVPRRLDRAGALRRPRQYRDDLLDLCRRRRPGHPRRLCPPSAARGGRSALRAAAAGRPAQAAGPQPDRAARRDRRPGGGHAGGAAERARARLVDEERSSGRSATSARTSSLPAASAISTT